MYMYINQISHIHIYIILYVTDTDMRNKNKNREMCKLKYSHPNVHIPVRETGYMKLCKRDAYIHNSVYCAMCSKVTNTLHLYNCNHGNPYTVQNMRRFWGS